ncbi:alkaline phosphatase D family protein [Sphingomonas endophytica]|uniref:Alkaline phosphatase n=1 Tax=Sphingomonas endophytica TaxID=869719 RepID=A0A147I1S3_9SPHN|nr:alkaline phosphatase D family protein [Sphingomonas endophytica]KTT71490.1 alkaline phosphatase [Sphingomonas endophytica]
MLIHRRSLLAGAGALTAVPLFAATGGVARGFTHGVASGEPAANSVLLWTRCVLLDGTPGEVQAELSERPDMAGARAVGAQITGPWRDYTVKITADGLTPDRWYYFRFVAPDGSRSMIGRTRTLPADGVRPWRAAIFSCSNLGFGFFNAYGHAAARDDLDCAIHLGDYFYEYAPDHYPATADTVPGRIPLPMAETVHLADYRQRFASYRADPDLQSLHARLPMIAQWDDHESANDSWEGGAQNHDPATEGDWNSRRDASIQAYREWMPVSDEPWKTYDIGALATVFRTETRLLGRTEQPDLAPLFKEADPVAALRAFRDGAWQDPGKTMMGWQQESWLNHAMAASVRSGRPWQIVGFGTIMGQTDMPADAADWMKGATAGASSYVLNGVTATRAGLPFNVDNWGGYPAARARFLRAAQGLGGNTVLISGDSHNAWAYDLAQDGRPAAVEFAGHSVTSPGFESATAYDPRRIAADLVRANPELKWCDTSRRGYMALTIAADRVDNDWIMVDTIKRRGLGATIGHRASVLRGRRVMA